MIDLFRTNPGSATILVLIIVCGVGYALSGDLRWLAAVFWTMAAGLLLARAIDARWGR